MPNPQPFLLTQVLEKIIQRAIYPYHFLTAEQILRIIGYSPGTIKTLKGYLKTLTDEKYLHSFYLPTATAKRPYVYCLGMRGRKYLKSQDIDADVYYLPSESEEKSYSTLMHILETNDVLISASLLTRLVSNLYLYDMQHDLTLKKKPFTALDTNGKTHALIPDGLLDLRLERPGKKDRRYFFWIELDRDTHSNDSFRDKIRNILLFVERQRHAYYFGIEQPIPFLFVTTAGEKRVEKMRQLARLEFSAKETSSKNLMLKFAAAPPLMQPQDDPFTLWTEPAWLSPYSDLEHKAALIELS